MVMTSAILVRKFTGTCMSVVVVRLMLQLSVCVCVLSPTVTNLHCKHRSCKTLVTRFNCECHFLNHDKSKFIYLKLQSSDIFFLFGLNLVHFCSHRIKILIKTLHKR
uniref:(northern house mosquito) hypothetical protein n=1 Tax=Culex pipiens TaxID=7175 RepID=A0A8D8G8R1_CULPI